MTSWRAALRVARREARRARGRSALVIAMIALPVAVMVFAAVTYDTFTLRPDEEADRLMGAGQAAMRWPQDGPLYQDPAELFYPDQGRADRPAGGSLRSSVERSPFLTHVRSSVKPRQHAIRRSFDTAAPGGGRPPWSGPIRGYRGRSPSGATVVEAARRAAAPDLADPATTSDELQHGADGGPMDAPPHDCATPPDTDANIVTRPDEGLSPAVRYQRQSVRQPGRGASAPRWIR
jgi:hypothetical protein